MGGLSGYEIRWTYAGGTDTSEHRFVDVEEVRIDGLRPGIYQFEVTPIGNGERGAATAIQWAGAVRYDTDMLQANTPLRLYEAASNRGSGLAIDLIGRGAARVKIGEPVAIPPLITILAVDVDESGDGFDIGPPLSFPRYLGMPAIDTTALLSSEAFSVESLYGWGLGSSIEALVRSSGTMHRFSNIPGGLPTGRGIGFVMRVGIGYPVPLHHYLKVFIRNIDGRLLHGEAPNRYIELEVSYQTVPNVPFARHTAPVASVGATQRR